MRPIDADAFKKYIDAQEGRPFIGCTVGEAMKILIDEQPTIQPEPTDEQVEEYCKRRCLHIVTDDFFRTIQPEERTEKRTETHACDLIDREAAVDAIYHHLPSVSRTEVRLMLHEVSSVQPERTCVNCGRTVNNGGWYADGGTRCPIEEHYALPKDGFCHLWEKRNVTDDDYPERRTDE